MKITQKSLRSVIKMQQQIADLSAKLKAAEDSVHEALKGGADVQGGLLCAYIKTFERRHISWKEVCEREIGEEKVNRIFAATPKQTYSNLVVELACKILKAA